MPRLDEVFVIRETTLSPADKKWALSYVNRAREIGKQFSQGQGTWTVVTPMSNQLQIHARRFGDKDLSAIVQDVSDNVAKGDMKKVGDALQVAADRLEELAGSEDVTRINPMVEELRKAVHDVVIKLDKATETDGFRVLSTVADDRQEEEWPLAWSIYREFREASERLAAARKLPGAMELRYAANKIVNQLSYRLKNQKDGRYDNTNYVIKFLSSPDMTAVWDAVRKYRSVERKSTKETISRFHSELKRTGKQEFTGEEIFGIWRQVDGAEPINQTRMPAGLVWTLRKVADLVSGNERSARAKWKLRGTLETKEESYVPTMSEVFF